MRIESKAGCDNGADHLPRCGAILRIPERATYRGSHYSCPRCKADVPIPEQAQHVQADVPGPAEEKPGTTGVTRAVDVVGVREAPDHPVSRDVEEKVWSNRPGAQVLTIMFAMVGSGGATFAIIMAVIAAISDYHVIPSLGFSCSV